MELLEIYNDDCFNIFPKIKDNSIDLFILDLPYGQTACAWDTCIDLNKMWIEIKRMMKPSAVICFFCTTKFGYSLIKSNEKWFKYDLVWKKSKKVGFLSANKRQLRNHENIYIFKNKQGTYNPQKTEGKPYNKTNTGNNNKDGCSYGIVDRSSHLEGEGNRKINKGERHPTSVIEHNSVWRSTHRTEKPVGLLEYLIKSYSNEGDTVMDFTMGSASCGEACFNTKRKFIGVEKDDDIFLLAQERLSNLE